MPIVVMNERPRSRKWHDSNRKGMSLLACNEIKATYTGQVTGQVAALIQVIDKTISRVTNTHHWLTDQALQNH
jgi:hypothetical protein